MNPNAEKLVTALRSGEFKQTNSCLRNSDDGYCCLGVACEIFRRETENGRWELVVEGDGYYDFILERRDAESFYLPDMVIEWLGARDHKASWNESKSDENLVALNDNGQTFAEIADAIERHDTNLFAPSV